MGHFHTLFRSGSLVAMLAAMGCSASTNGAGGAAGAPGGMNTAGAPVTGSNGSSVTFTEVYGILMQNCAGAGCHASGFAAAGLSLANKSTAYASLVGAGSTKCRGQQRVVAGNPDTSVLVHAVEHTTFSSCRPPAMPEGKAALPQSAIDTITTWIADGAPND
jgi:hypothetical protein